MVTLPTFLLYFKYYTGMAQSGRASRLGRESRRFKSCYLYHLGEVASVGSLQRTVNPLPLVVGSSILSFPTI